MCSTAPHALWSCINFDSLRASRTPPARFCVLANYAAVMGAGVVRVFVILRSDMREARAEWAKRLEARAGTERLAETRWLSKPLACGYEVHADARKPRRQPGGPPEKGTATALCPRRLLNVSLVLFDCPA